MKKIYFIIIFLLAAGLGGWFFINRVELKQDVEEWRMKRDLPAEVTVIASTSTNVKGRSNPDVFEQNNGIATLPEFARNEVNVVARNDSDALPSEINLSVPFVVQAPYANWDNLHEEACEEASLIMLNAFYQGIQKISPEEAESAIQKLVKWEKDNLGFFEDTTAEENVRILKEYFGLSGARAVYDITVEDIKKELAQGRPVLVPAAGKLLPNPYFRNGGPLYHMLLIKGYTKDGRFITNDPGTKRGADFTYKFEDLMNAIHDWNNGDVVNGRRVIIVVK